MKSIKICYHDTDALDVAFPDVLFHDTRSIPQNPGAMQSLLLIILIYNNVLIVALSRLHFPVVINFPIDVYAHAR